MSAGLVTVGRTSSPSMARRRPSSNAAAIAVAFAPPSPWARGERSEVAGREPTQPLMLGEQASGELQYALLLGAGAQEDCQQLGGGERLRAEARKLFARGRSLAGISAPRI